ncbi:hypothetical protein IV203_013351 [Nitzschia inconspicua]|uniref:ShKT domain-containing protein n=1 Tax=Nitzschia inconspicua TaxID=303405 RepID=A0A9K3M6V5_9STRA|nr:hypothetical protein IV203_013351 [Nitzschia inconspicua]
MKFLYLLLSLFCVSYSRAALVESDRLKEYHARNYTWPLPLESYVPPTEGWKNLMEHRLRQVSEIDTRRERYEGFVQTLNAAIVAPNFTQYGWGLAKAPDDLMEALRQGIREGVEKGPSEEAVIQEIVGDHPPWFVDRPDLTKRVLEELQHFPETWVGLELQPHRAYGFRLYRNNSQLFMHIDKSQTHIVSFILHIDSSDDAEPWPIAIEDFQGNLHEVVLASGDLLFYESSKVFHGRPRKFNGSWYSSVFVHYYPKYGWAESDHDVEKHYAVPPIWHEDPKHHFEVPLEVLGTGMREPTCPNGWCQTQHSIYWDGKTTKSEHGKWIAPTGEKFDFVPKRVECKDLDEQCPLWASWETDECKKNPGFMLVHCKKSCNACTIPGGNDEL